MSWLKKISNCIKWFPVIWKDNDWDYEYFLLIIKFKLKQMLKFYHSDKTHLANSDITAEQIEQALMLLNDYLDNDYNELEFEQHRKKYGKAEFNCIPIDNEHCRLEIVYPLADNQEKANAEYVAILKDCDKQRQINFELFFEWLKDNLQNWWD